jgi:membrane associated rhomboid family serine protease
MSVTIIIIIFTVIVSMYSWNNHSVYYQLMLNPYAAFHQKKYYQLITSGFIHADYGHLIFNMLTLYFFGTVIEQVYGYIYPEMPVFMFLLLYVLGIVVASLPSFFAHKDNANYNTLGASGGVSAVVFSAILYNPNAPLCLYFVLCLPGFIFGILYLIYSYYQGKRMADNVNHSAHIWGALFGIVFNIAIYPKSVLIFISEIANFKLFG